MKQPESARSHYERQQRLTAAAVRTARTAPDAAPSRLAAIVALYQALAARDAAEAVPQMLTELGISPTAPLRVAWQALTGIASDGRPLESLMSVVETEPQLDMVVTTQIQDAARVSAGVAIASRRQVTRYARMLNPPSCARCAILAGRVYRWDAGFERHPRCDCRAIPANEASVYDLRTHPDEYFDSLTREQQDKIFTKGGAQAIRDGADIFQVVNARSGMKTSSEVLGEGAAAAHVRAYGNELQFTLSGTTKRGVYGRLEDQRRGGFTQERTGRRQGYVKDQVVRRAKRARLMPESIYQLANGDRDEALRLLKLYGYLI